MRKKFNLGHSDFKDIIENNNYFIDKSMLIDEVLNEQKAVLLFPRPRRFDKTLNLSMLRYFFDKSMPENKNLFKESNGSIILTFYKTDIVRKKLSINVKIIS